MMLELDKADKNSQRPETYDAMLKTTEREAKDQITKQINKYTRNGGRRYREPPENSLKSSPWNRRLRPKC